MGPPVFFPLQYIMYCFCVYSEVCENSRQLLKIMVFSHKTVITLDLTMLSFQREMLQVCRLCFTF